MNEIKAWMTLSWAAEHQKNCILEICLKFRHTVLPLEFQQHSEGLHQIGLELQAFHDTQTTGIMNCPNALSQLSGVQRKYINCLNNAAACQAFFSPGFTYSMCNFALYIYLHICVCLHKYMRACTRNVM